MHGILLVIVCLCTVASQQFRVATSSRDNMDNIKEKQVRIELYLTSNYTDTCSRVAIICQHGFLIHILDTI